MDRKCVVDGLYPAFQFHLRVATEGGKYGPVLTDEERNRITEALTIPFSGLVDISFAGSRVIITNTLPAETSDYWVGVFQKAIEGAL